MSASDKMKRVRVERDAALADAARWKADALLYAKSSTEQRHEAEALRRIESRLLARVAELEEALQAIHLRSDISREILEALTKTPLHEAVARLAAITHLARRALENHPKEPKA